MRGEGHHPQDEGVDRGQVSSASADDVGSGVPTLRGLAPDLVLSALLPFICYRILLAQGVATVSALAWASVFPLAGLLLGWVRTRTLDAIAFVALIFIASSVLVGLVTGSARANLLVGSARPALFGLAFLTSLLLARPLTFYFAKQFASGGDPSRMSLYEARWQDQDYEDFRHGHRITTAVWGVAFLLEAVVFTALVLNFDPEGLGGVTSLISFGVLVGLVVWTNVYVSRLESATSDDENAAEDPTGR
jgi:hypothetical protein